MASKLLIRVRSNKTQSQLDAQLLEGSASVKQEQVERLKDFLSGLQAGADKAVLELPVDQDSATGTFTVGTSGAQSLTIAGSTLTGGTDYTIANLTATQIATNIVEAINDSEDPSIQLVVADSSAGVVVVTARDSGLAGNYIPISGSGEITASAATLADGTSGELRILNMNLVL